MVWIHGGLHIAGAGTSDNYHPLFYMSHQVIVVQVRYRLGLLGFPGGLEDVPGNAQGQGPGDGPYLDPRRTSRVWRGPGPHCPYNGESAGSFSSTYHLMSLSRGLFRRAILPERPGGFPFLHTPPPPRPRSNGELAAVELGCLSTVMAEVAACMREAPHSTLAIEVLNELMSPIH